MGCINASSDIGGGKWPHPSHLPSHRRIQTVEKTTPVLLLYVYCLSIEASPGSKAHRDGMCKPIFVCVPEASYSPLVYDPVKFALAHYGYEVNPIALPSIGRNPATYDFTEDVRAIRNYIAQLADSGRDVILVMHGYGGLPGAEALFGLGKMEREQRGQKGGVVRLVFIISVCILSIQSTVKAQGITKNLRIGLELVSKVSILVSEYRNTALTNAKSTTLQYMAKEGFQGSARGDISAMFPYLRCNLNVRPVSTIPLSCPSNTITPGRHRNRRP